jgi:NADH:ubiquinone oxidoreductase subunit 5 (subunit L)/multisubunit Na+/H+ antiporter MnhA subunit
MGRIDYEGLDQTLVDGVGRTTQVFGEKLKQVQTGRLQNYMLFALIGVILILVFQAA